MEPEQVVVADSTRVVAAGIAKLVVFYDVVAGLLPLHTLGRV